MAPMDTEKTISRPGNGPTMEEKTLIKIPVTLQEAEALTTEARQAGKSRGEYCREILMHHLQGQQAGPSWTNQDQIQALEEARKAIEGLRMDNGILTERSTNQAGMIEELRARAIHAEGLVQTLMAERQALIPERTGGFWSRLFGRG